ncbi:MAG TPA: hypothetical protein VFP55_12575 [Solirubrobacteraceae bacterium]|nr:hypothetical protein [Solirubrobacteraceae bacterium]
MSIAKLAAAGGLLAVTSCVSACGIQAKPVAGTVRLDHAPGNHSLVSDPRTPYISCLHHAGFTVTKFVDGPQKLRSLQINTAPAGPTVVFEPTPGIAEGDQMKAEEEAAEVIGSALIYPNHASDSLMQKVDTCLAHNVKG